jgi:hypothetical protein
MNSRQGWDNGKGAGGGRKSMGRPAAVLALTSPRERLDYIADMVRALRTISAQGNCETLSDLLDLVYHEALQRRRAGKAG